MNIIKILLTIRIISQKLKKDRSREREYELQLKREEERIIKLKEERKKLLITLIFQFKIIEII